MQAAIMRRILYIVCILFSKLIKINMHACIFISCVAVTKEERGALFLLVTRRQLFFVLKKFNRGKKKKKNDLRLKIIKYAPPYIK